VSPLFTLYSVDAVVWAYTTDVITSQTQADRPVLDLPATEGWKAELIWVVGYISRWFWLP